MQTRYAPLVLFAAGLAASVFAAEQPLVIDLSQSRVEVAVKATVDSFVGHLATYDPVIVVGDDGVVRSARFTFQFKDLATGKEGRDKAMHKWQQTEKYPEGVFVLTALEPRAGATADAFGRLTFHGVTRDVRFPVSINREGTRFAIDGDAPVDTREYGLPIIRVLGLLKVDPIVHVRFHLQGAPEGAVAIRR